MKPSKLTQYRRLVAWAQRRYTINHELIVSVGGVPSLYSRIEDAAFEKYMRLERDNVASLVFSPD